MKKIFNILLILAIPIAVLSGCVKFDDKAFEKSSSERVQALMDGAFETLTSWDEGWYLEYFPGWTASAKTGGYWVWCKFNTDYTVEVMSEAVNKYPDDYDPNKDPEGLVMPEFTRAESSFGIIRGRGALISFNLYNEVIAHWITPNSGAPNALQGDSEFQIAEVTDDMVTVKGVRTGTTMRFHKKTGGGDVTSELAGFIRAGKKYRKGRQFETTVNGAFVDTEKGYPAPTARLSSRAITVNYCEIIKVKKMDDKGGVVKDKNGEIVMENDTIQNSVRLPFIPKLKEVGIDLSSPVDVIGNKISGFSFDEATGTFVSDDAGQTISLVQIIVPPVTMADVVGSYVMNGVSYFDGPFVSNNIGIREKNASTVIISGVENLPFEFEATLDSGEFMLSARDMQDTGYEQDGVKIYFANGNQGNVIFEIIEAGLLSCSDMWGFYSDLGWFGLYTSATFTKK